MDLRRLRIGEWVAATAGIALLVSLLLPWYGARDETVSAWEALAANDVLLAIVAASGVLLAIVTATQRVPAVSIALAGLVTLAGLLGVLLVLLRAIDLPAGVEGREWALWLALASVLGVVAGGVQSMRDERLSKPGRPTDATGRPAPPPAEIERIPAPRP